MNIQAPDDIAVECLQLPDCHKRGLLRGVKNTSAAQTLTGSNLALYTRINGLPEAQQLELVKLLEEDLYTSDRLLAKNIRLGKKRNNGKINWSEVEAS